MRLLGICAEEEGHDLAAGAVVIRAERGVGGAVGHLAGDRPAHSVRVESVRGNVDEARGRAGAALEGAIQERHALAARAGGVGSEGRLGHAVRDAVLDRL